MTAHVTATALGPLSLAFHVSFPDCPSARAADRGQRGAASIDLSNRGHPTSLLQLVAPLSVPSAG